MATPIGHALVGALVARRLGVRTHGGQLAAVVASGLPDVDVILGALLHRDPWKLHKQGTHTLSFTMIAGALAGLTGAVSVGDVDGDRDLVADALAGAVVASTHLVLDRAPLPYIKVPKRGPWREILVKSAFNWALDAVVYGALWARFQPRLDDNGTEARRRGH